MAFPKLEDMNSERFLNEAFDEQLRIRSQKNARIRRNIYLGLFLTGMVCMVYTAMIDRMTLCVLSLFLATVSLVVMTKYDTQLHFLNILHLRELRKDVEQDYS